MTFRDEMPECQFRLELKIKHLIYLWRGLIACLEKEAN